MKCFALVLFYAACSSCFVAAAQTQPGHSVFDPHELFAQNFFSNTGNEFRTASGMPGPAYWQNRADYELHVTLDTITDKLDGSETIHYRNNSPGPLTSLWLELDQNTYRDDARSNFYTRFPTVLENPHKPHTNGFECRTVTIEYNGQTMKADYLLTDTRMQIRLPKALASKDAMAIHISYSYKIPGAFGGRNDVFATKNGKLYEMAQWYPRMCVYDDLRGWNTLPFLGSGEFYCEYGDIDYTVSVPAGMLVAGSGALQNEAAVLTGKQRTRLAAARNSDTTVMIRSAAEVNEDAGKTMPDRLVSWHFKMYNTRDVAFGASNAYMWDAARVNLPGGKKALAMSVYPVESAGPDRWGRATEYLKKSIEYFSEKWFVYPYPVAVNELVSRGEWNTRALYSMVSMTKRASYTG